MHLAEATCAPRSYLQFTTVLVFYQAFYRLSYCLVVRPSLPRSGESLDEGGHCVVVVVAISVPVHGGIQHERGAASANNGQKSLTYLGGWAELRGGISLMKFPELIVPIRILPLFQRFHEKEHCFII